VNRQARQKVFRFALNMLRRTVLNFSGALGRRRVVLPFFFLIFALLSSAWFTIPDGTGRAESSPQSGAVTTQTEVKSGLQRTIFTTPGGSRIYINLPEDLRRGETCSGSVFGEVSGKTEPERAAGQADLGSYTVEIAGQKIPATGKTFKLEIPAAVMKDDLLGIILRNKKGKEVARADIKVATQATSRGTSFRLPTVQLGNIIEVDCPCDGVIADTDDIKVDGTKILILAESPRKKVALNTNPTEGHTELEVSEGGQVIKGAMRNLGIKLSVLKAALLKGERTTLTVEVSGLEGLEQDVPLHLENQTTSVMTMGPSNVQEITIKPADVLAGGKYKIERGLTGIRVGNFLIEGTVIRRDVPVATVRKDEVAPPVTPPSVIVDLQSDQEVTRIREALIKKIQGLSLRPPPPPEITLVSPAIGSLVKGSPLISWKVSGLPGEVQRVFYSLRVVEVLPDQSLQEALLKNPPAFERNGLTDSSYQVPREGGLESGKVYAFYTTAFGPGGVEVSRSSGSFFAIGAWPPWSFCWLFNLGPVDYCINQSAGVTVAFAFMTGSGNFSWTLSCGGTGSSGSGTITIPASMLPPTPGTYNCTLTVTRGTCTRSTTITINAFPPSAVGGTAVVASSPNPICDGQTAVLDVQGESGNVGQWEYSDNNGPWLNATSAFFIAGAPANTNPMQPSSCTAPNWYTDRRFRAVVSTSNAANAPSCSTTYSAPTTLRIYCKPVAGNLTASTTRFCKYSPPASITLTMAGTIVGNISWSANPGGPIAGSGNTITVPAPTTTTTYTATVTTGGSGGSCPSVSTSVQVIVDDQPFCTSPNTALTVDKNIVCPGDAAVLTLSNCSGIVTWQQSLSGPGGPWTTISAGNSVQNTTDLFVATWWRAIISGPPGGTCPPITSNVVVINVMTPPATPVVATPAPVCFGGSATLSSNLPPLPLGWTYQWYHDDLPIAACNNQPTCTFAPAEPGNYWVEVSNGCQTVQSNFVILPVDIVTVQINAPCCGNHTPLTLSATANSSLSGAITNPNSFVWSVNGVPIGGGTSITVNPTTTTTYCVTVTSPNGCTAQSCTTVTVCP